LDQQKIYYTKSNINQKLHKKKKKKKTALCHCGPGAWPTRSAQTSSGELPRADGFAEKPSAFFETNPQTRLLFT
jgi:hypothetical protein